MKTEYVLIDYENVQPKDLSRLAGRALKVVLFVGASQAKIPFELAQALQALGKEAEYLKISGSGRNALDFHIAFHLGELASKHPDASFHVISKDTGFDPLLRHLKERGFAVRRARDLAEVGDAARPKATSGRATKAVPAQNERLDAIVNDLRNRPQSRPRRRKTLASSINSLFLKSKLQPSEVDALIEALEQRGMITVEGTGKVAYRL